MALPNVPISQVPAVGNPSFPSLDSISVADLVGPQAANRQPVSLDTRSQTLRQQLNLTIQAVNAIGAGPGGTDIFLRRDGTLAMLNHLDVGGFRLVNVGDPIADSHALNRLYADGRYVNVTGDEMTGSLVMAHNVPIRAKDSGGVEYEMLKIDGSDDAILGALSLRNIIESNQKLYRRTGVSLYQLWDSNNQGPGTGMNADLLDGLHALVFSRLDVAGIQTHAGKLRSPSTTGADAATTLVTKDYVDAQGSTDRFRNEPDSTVNQSYDFTSSGLASGTWYSDEFEIGWNPVTDAPGLLKQLITGQLRAKAGAAVGGFTTRNYTWVLVNYVGGIVSNLSFFHGGGVDVVAINTDGTWADTEILHLGPIAVWNNEAIVAIQASTGGGFGNKIHIRTRMFAYVNPGGTLYGFTAQAGTTLDQEAEWFVLYGF